MKKFILAVCVAMFAISAQANPVVSETENDASQDMVTITVDYRYTKNLPSWAMGSHVMFYFYLNNQGWSFDEIYISENSQTYSVQVPRNSRLNVQFYASVIGDNYAIVTMDGGGEFYVEEGEYHDYYITASSDRTIVYTLREASSNW